MPRRGGRTAANRDAKGESCINRGVTDHERPGRAVVYALKRMVSMLTAAVILAELELRRRLAPLGGPAQIDRSPQISNP
jgi:hypothetical protein